MVTDAKGNIHATDGRFAGHVRQDSGTELESPLERDLRSDLANTRHLWASHGSDVSVYALFPTSTGASPCDSVDLHAEADGSVLARVSWQDVDMIEWGRLALGAGEDDDDRIIEFLEQHSQQINDFWAAHDVQAEGFEWGSETLVLEQRFGATEPVSWELVGAAFHDAPAFHYVSAGLGDPNHPMGRELAEACGIRHARG